MLKKLHAIISKARTRSLLYLLHGNDCQQHASRQSTADGSDVVFEPSLHEGSGLGLRYYCDIFCWHCEPHQNLRMFKRH